MFDNLIQNITALSIPPELIVIIVGALPIAELRGAIPLAMFSFHMPWYEAFVLSVLGNIIPVPIILLFLGKIATWASRTKIGKRFFDWLFRHTSKKGSSINRYKWTALMAFVAIPLPFTGAWTGSIIAFLLDLKFWYAFSSIAVGVLLAGVIVTALSLMGWTGGVIAGVALIIAIIISLRKKNDSKSEKKLPP